MWRATFIQQETFERWRRRAETVSRQPGWVLKAALVAAVLVVVVPLLLLTLAAVAVGVAVFVVLALVAWIAAAVRGLLEGLRGDGRRNVRVIHHD